ncbi:MAG: ABC transporter ATP-binding protein [Micropruina glycogenica]|uniref:Iron(III)-siderophore transporter (ATP binding component) n=1 Tax=Micropruina glycogenica TaxID=75385 RepID=A0A2N9JF70_9ACTN|nr:ABC transporter ATP-binding protein [Micropruina glycogenica]SPD86054.1 iron(III)-siderophore transporter (ATP binding component) [Micropruina glycogenica]
MSASIPSPGRLRAESVTLRYDQRVVSTGLSVDVPGDEFTVIIGPNACGKSTLLRSLSRLLRPAAGEVTLDGRSLASFKPKEFARTVGLLPQSSIAPEGITVVDLVSRGRFPYQKLVRQWTDADEAAVRDAMTATNVAELATREVAELSGGQRQRVWAAMAIAQQTPILLLDEPTTYLDLTHQIEMLDLFARLHRAGTTIVAVLHDLNQAARYATHLIVLKAGEVIATGAPSEVLTEHLVREVFELNCVVMPDPVSGTPLIVPTDGEWR